MTTGQEPSEHEQEHAQPPAIVVEEVTAVHGHRAHARTTLAPTSMSVRPGESVAVVGRSGAGKSTLADIVLGLRSPASGSVTVCGEHWCSAGRRPPKHLRSLVQGVPQDAGAAFVPRWTLRQSIERAVRALGSSGRRAVQTTDPTTGRPTLSLVTKEFRDPARSIDDAAELAQLDRSLLNKRPSEVSGGQAQRAALTRALAVGPTVLVADEPTSALDPRTAEAVSTAVLSVVKDAGITLLLVTHDPEFADRCTRQVRITAPDLAAV